MSNILICDDEKDIVKALKIYLTNLGDKIFEAYDGLQALDILKKEEIHLVLMDIMMPQMSGIEALRQLREFSNVPVILLTAKSEDMDIILGLNTGADDYITKPFHPLEVTARVRSQLRRYLSLGGKTEASHLVIGGLELDDDSKQVRAEGNLISLTPKEYEILKLLMSNPGKVYSPRAIYEAVWKEPLFGSENTVAVHICHLRDKIEINPSDPRYIKVIFGQGYKIEKGGFR